jgi:hypothetical protein
MKRIMARCTLAFALILALCFTQLAMRIQNVTGQRISALALADYFECDRMHVVNRGENCWIIANIYKISIENLLWKNPYINCRRLYAGESMCVDDWNGNSW